MYTVCVGVNSNEKDEEKNQEKICCANVYKNVLFMFWDVF